MLSERAAPGRPLTALCDRMTSAKPALALLGALVLAGCLHGGEEEPAARAEPPPSGQVTLAEHGGERGHTYVAGDRLYGWGPEAEKLGGAINTNLIGTLSPAAVASGRRPYLLVYNSWRARRPVLRLRGLDTGRDRVLEEGALSVAWREDGRLAYFKALRPDLGAPKTYVGHVVARRALQAPVVRWTSKPGRYVVAAWARGRVLAYRLGPTWPDLLALDGRRRERVLAKAGALVAVSPDGRRAFVSTYGTSPPVVRVLDVESGEELARRTITRLRWLTESGSWSGDAVAATASAGVAVFRVGARTIVLEQVLGFTAAGFSLGPFEPRLDYTGRSIVAWGELEPRPRQAVAQAVLVECDRVTLRCFRGGVASSTAPPRPVYIPSRP
jgi:hypothetical protein